MRHLFPHRMQWFLLIGTLLGLWGCANMMETIPTPPDFLTPVQLNGPYDADIPIRQTNQIKRASFMLDWAVPYVFISVGAHFEPEGDPVRSIHFFNRAIDEFRKRENVSGEGSAFSQKISALMGFGNLQAAYLAIGEQEKKWPHAPFNAFVFYNYGYYYLKNGDYAKARKYFEQALHANPTDPENSDLLALRRDTELKYGITLILADYLPAVAGRLCLIDLDEDFYKNTRRNIVEGLSHLERVSALNNELQHKPVIRYFPGIIPSSMEGDLYNFLGLAYGMTGKVPKAVKYLERAAGVTRKSEYRLGEADGSFFLNHVYLIDKDRHKGIKAAQDLEEIARRNGLVSYSIWAKMLLAHHYKETGDIDRTIAAIHEALTLMENDASWISVDRDFRGIGFFKPQAIYEALLELYAGKGDERGAFKTAERAKAAVLADALAAEVSGTTPVVLDALKQMHLYRKQMAEHYIRLLSPANGNSVFMDTVAKMDKVRRARVDELAGIKKNDEAIYLLMGGTPPDADEIQRVMEPDTTLFAYYVGEKCLYVWVISKDGFHQKKISMSRKDVDLLVQMYLRAMTSKDKNQVNVLSERVYDTFLKPVIHFVYGDRVGFVPHGTLYNLPFASMRYVKAYLVDGFTIFHLPHAGMIKRALSKKVMPQTKKALIYADPQHVEKQKPASHSEAETDTLKRLFPQADYVVKENASKANLQKLTGNYDVLHFSAATGTCYGGLSVHDIVRLQLSGRVTVFGDCLTTKGVSSADTGMLSLVAAWLYTVSPSVITTLWRVEDESRAAWVEMFYENLRKSGNVSDALRTAQNGMIQMGYGPSDWAAFVLIGHD